MVIVDATFSRRLRAAVSTPARDKREHNSHVEIPELARVPADPEQSAQYARRSLNRHPTLLGYCLVAPKRHVEDWVHDLDDTEFLTLQRVVRKVARAVSAVVPTERMYCLSLGSQQGNAPSALAHRAASPGRALPQAAVLRPHVRKRRTERRRRHPGSPRPCHQEPPLTCRSTSALPTALAIASRASRTRAPGAVAFDPQNSGAPVSRRLA